MCDTVGHATPDGVRALVSWVRDLVDTVSPEVKVDWHGHQDRGLGVDQFADGARSRRAPRARHGPGNRRARRQHADGPAARQPPAARLDRPRPDRRSRATARSISEATGVPLTDNYPIVGKDAFRTGTGVHAAAIIKARNKGDEWLADRVYSGVPAAMVGRHQKIEVGPMSGESNVVYWLSERGIEVTRSSSRRSSRPRSGATACSTMKRSLRSAKKKSVEIPRGLLIRRRAGVRTGSGHRLLRAIPSRPTPTISAVERGLSRRTVESYVRDLDGFGRHLAARAPRPAERRPAGPRAIRPDRRAAGLSARSAARLLSSLRGFFRYCSAEGIVSEDSSAQLTSPKTWVGPSARALAEGDRRAAGGAGRRRRRGGCATAR